MRAVTGRDHARGCGVRITGATVTSALATNGAHGSEAEDRKRQALTNSSRTSGVFDAVADFDQATVDPKDRRTACGVRARQHHRRTGRQAPSQPRRLISRWPSRSISIGCWVGVRDE